MQGFLIKLCLRSSNWHFAHFILQFPSTAHLHGNPHETRKGQISQFVTSRQISGKFFPEPDCVQFLAPKHLHHSATKKVLPHFHHPASVSPASGPEGSLVWVWVWIDVGLLDHALTPASLPAPADRCPAPRVAPSFLTFSPHFSVPAEIPQRTLCCHSLFTSHVPKKLSRLGVSLRSAFWQPLPHSRRAGRPVRTGCQPTLTWCRLEPGKAGSQPASQEERLRDPPASKAAPVRRTPERRLGGTKGIQ